MPRPCTVLRVFTRAGEGGNHLGVVTDLDGLDTASMQQIAADLGFSETVFIEMGDVPAVRIFTPEMELPFAGHPLVGAAHFLLELTSGAVTRIRYGLGEARVRAEGGLVWIDVPMFIENAFRDGAIFARRVGLTNPVTTWRVQMPLDYRVIELATADDVAAADPSPEAFGAAFGLAVFARTGERVRMRFFSPDAGVSEDPATGSAAVALATRFAAAGEPNGSASIDQGEEMGHPSRIELRWEGRAASIGGTVTADEVRELPL